MNLQSIRIELDKATSLVPLLSTLTNGVNLVQKLFVLPNMSSEEIEKNTYYSYLQSKSINQISLEMIPLIGNAYAFHQKKLWNRPEFVLRQIQKDPSNLLRASLDLQSNPKFLIQACAQNKKILNFLSTEIKEKNIEFCLGILATYGKETKELQKNLYNLCLEYEIYRDCSDDLQPLIDEPSFDRKKKSSLKFLYAHAQSDYNKSYDLLKNTLEENKKIHKEINEQTARLQDLNSEIENDVSNNLSKADEIIEDMEHILLYLQAPGYILHGMNALLDTGVKVTSCLIQRR